MANSPERWFYVYIPHACFGLGSQDDVIFFAQPIAAWMIGKTLQEVKPFLLEKKAKVIELKKQ